MASSLLLDVGRPPGLAFIAAIASDAQAARSAPRKLFCSLQRGRKIERDAVAGIRTRTRHQIHSKKWCTIPRARRAVRVTPASISWTANISAWSPQWVEFARHTTGEPSPDS